MVNSPQENSTREGKVSEASWYERLVLPLSLIAASGCGGEVAPGADRDFQQATTGVSRIDNESNLLVSVERAFLSPEKALKDQEVFVQSVPVEFHLSGLLSSSIGTVNLSFDRGASDSYLVLDVKSSHALFPDTKVGIKVDTIVRIEGERGQSYIAIRFLGREDSGEQHTIILDEGKSSEVTLDIHADVNLSTLEGRLDSIDASYVNHRAEKDSIQIGGDPTKSYMQFRAGGDRSAPRVAFDIKRKRYF